MSYTTVTSRTSRHYAPLSGVGSSTLSPAWIAIGALVIGGLLYSNKSASKPLRANKSRRSLRRSRRSSHRR